MGPTDRGKSAIIRALRFIALNKAPKGVIRSGAATTRVSLKVDDTRVVRSKGKVNYYQVGEQKLKAFGASVPQDVADLLKINEDNFQRQHDAAFWFSKSPSEVSKRLNQIVNLEVIDKALANAAARVRKANATREVVETRVRDAEAELKQMEWMPKLLDEHAHLTWLEAAVADAGSQRASLKSLFTDLREKQTRAKRLRLARVDGDAALQLGQQALDAQKQIKDLRKLIETIERLDRTLERGAPDLAEITTSVEKHRQIRYDGRELSAIIKRLALIESDQCNLKTMLTRTEKKIKQKTGGVCPVCRGPLPTS